MTQCRQPTDVNNGGKALREIIYPLYVLVTLSKDSFSFTFIKFYSQKIFVIILCA